MSGNDLLFVVLPYAAAAILVVVTIIRWRTHEFTVSSMSSQLLESRRLYWGSISFHWGLTLILLGHLLALLVPRSFELWNAVPLQLFLLIRAQRQGQQLLAFGLNEHYHQIFELTRLNEAIAILPTEAQAIEAAV